jgi:tetratricopeptide (TPR) repeat protein
MHNNPKYQNAIALMNARQWQQAEFELGHLMLLNPQQPALYAALSECAYYRRQMRQAVAFRDKAYACLGEMPSFHDVLYVSKLFHFTGETAQALGILESTVLRQAIDDRQRLDLAIYYLSLDAVAEALAAFRAVPATQFNDYDRTMHAMAVLYSGNVDSARELFLEALRINPANAGAAHRLSMLDVAEGRSARIAHCRAALNNTGPMQQALLQFALFNELDAAGDTQAAFEALTAANAVRKRTSGHDSQHETRLAEAFVSQLATLDFSGSEVIAPKSDHPAPVFILGLPRTGTTLLEKLIADRNDLAPVGEHMTFRKGIERQTGQVLGSLYELAESGPLSGLDPAVLGTFYRGNSEWRAAGHAFYTDKEPTNYMFCGFLAKALPDCRILHIRRNPMDACFSMYKQYFAPGSFECSYDLDDLAAHYLNYERVMAFWRQTLGQRMHEIRYEELVADPDRVIADALAYCQFGKALDAAAGYRTSTLSAAQVQKPVNRSGINAWAKYAEYLQPLRARLDGPYTAYMQAIAGAEIL